MLKCVKAIALCHNVSPVTDESHDLDSESHDGEVNIDEEEVAVLYERKVNSEKRISYQASSPDEVRQSAILNACYYIAFVDVDYIELHNILNIS